jgi:hypothetical protein
VMCSRWSLVHCDCCAGSAQEVAKCMAQRCPSRPFRMGKNPWRKPPSNEQREAMWESGRRLAKAQKSLPSDTEEMGRIPLASTREQTSWPRPARRRSRPPWPSFRAPRAPAPSERAVEQCGCSRLRISVGTWLFEFADALPTTAKRIVRPGALLRRRSGTGRFHTDISGSSVSRLCSNLRGRSVSNSYVDIG